MGELRECPCGRKVKLGGHYDCDPRDIGHGKHHGYAIEHDGDCPFMEAAFYRTVGRDDDHEAIKREMINEWNTRPTEDRYREALEFYAEKGNYGEGYDVEKSLPVPSSISADLGKIAREALSTDESEG